MPGLEVAVELAERDARDIRRVRRAGDRQMIAAADQRDAELPFDLRKMLVVLAIEQRQKPVVVEMDLNRRLLGRTGHRTQMPVLSSGTTAAPADGRSSSRVTIAPCRLLP